MKLPFTTEQFWQVFSRYNLAVWPMQIVFVVVALVAILLVIKAVLPVNRIMPGILGFLWIWMGMMYHIWYFAAINPAAYLFGILFILQGMLFLFFGFFNQRFAFRFRPDFSGFTGLLLIVFALIIYPAIGFAAGHRFPTSPTFGLPCPTTIFTFGVLLWSEKKVPSFILIVPALWSIIGFMAALKFGIKEDIGLPVSALIAITTLGFARKLSHKLA